MPCNNDLLAANFIDDGDQIWLIDYEYAGNNDACFELGNIWSECHLTLDELEELITAYYGKPLRNKVARAQLQGLMSRYGWTLWASIQDQLEPLGLRLLVLGHGEVRRSRRRLHQPRVRPTARRSATP